MAARVSLRNAKRSPLALTATVITVAIVCFLYWARVVVIPVALAILFTFILSPGVTALRRRGAGRIPSVAAVCSVALVVVAATTVLATWQLTALIQELPDHRDKIRSKLNQLTSAVGSASDGRVAALLNEITQALNPPSSRASNEDHPIPVVVADAQPGWQSAMGSWLGPVGEALARGALTLLLTIFLLLGKEDMRNRVLRIIGPRRLTATTKAVDDAASRISRYLRMQLLINAGFGVAVSLALLALQVPFAILWGFIAGLMRYVPYLGVWIGLIPPLVASVAMTDSWWQPVVVLAVFAVLEFLVNSVAEPRLFGQSLGLSEVALIVSAAFWAFLWGPIGLILSGPITACLLVLSKNVPQLRCLDVLLGDEEPLPPHMSLFQRLAARDRDEAWHVAREFAAKQSPERVVDGLLVPALALLQTAIDRRELTEDDGEWTLAAIREIDDDFHPAEAPAADSERTERLRVLLVPGGDRRDELALEFLAQRLDSASWEVHRLSSDELASEMAASVKKLQPAAVVVATVASGSLAHARYVCKRIRAIDSTFRLFVGCWGNGAPSDSLKSELAQVGVDEITTDVQSTQKMLSGSRTVLNAAATTIGESRPVIDRIGTVSALAKV